MCLQVGFSQGLSFGADDFTLADLDPLNKKWADQEDFLLTRLRDLKIYIHVQLFVFLKMFKQFLTKFIDIIIIV